MYYYRLPWHSLRSRNKQRFSFTDGWARERRILRRCRQDRASFPFLISWSTRLIVLRSRSPTCSSKKICTLKLKAGGLTTRARLVSKREYQDSSVIHEVNFTWVGVRNKSIFFFSFMCIYTVWRKQFGWIDQISGEIWTKMREIWWRLSELCSS